MQNQFAVYISEYSLVKLKCVCSFVCVEGGGCSFKIYVHQKQTCEMCVKGVWNACEK